MPKKQKHQLTHQLSLPLFSSPNKVSIWQKGSAYFSSHMRSLLLSIGEIIRAPFSALLIIFVIGITMALPGGFFVLIKNIQGFTHNFHGVPSISLYLRTNTSTSQISALENQLKSRDDVGNVQYISPKEGLQQFEKAVNLTANLSNLSENPLPPVLVITPSISSRTPRAVQHLFENIQHMPVVMNARLDMEWVKRLYHLVNLGHRVIYMLWCVFGLGVILIVGNTIKLIMQSHQEEVTVLRLVGATASFIKRPLLYRGLVYGVLGGIIANIFVAMMIGWLHTPIQRLAQSYNTTLSLRGLGLKGSINIIIICALFSWVGAAWAVRKYLRCEEVL